MRLTDKLYYIVLYILKKKKKRKKTGTLTGRRKREAALWVNECFGSWEGERWC